MIESIQALVENENAIAIITGAFFFYAIILWLLVPVWVYIDSKKKFNNPQLSLILFFIILPLNIPGILFYIIIRPEDELGFSDHSDHPGHSNLNIPVVNFVNGKEDIVMSLELKINSKVIDDKFKHDLNLDIDLNSNSEDVVIEHRDVEIEVEETDLDTEIEDSESFFSKISSSLTGFMSSVSMSKRKSNDEEDDSNEDAAVDESEVEVGINSNSEDDDQQKDSSEEVKKNSKRNRKKKKKSRR